MVGQYGKIFSSQDSVLSLPTVGPILPYLKLNYCPPAQKVLVEPAGSTESSLPYLRVSQEPTLEGVLDKRCNQHEYHHANEQYSG